MLGDPQMGGGLTSLDFEGRQPQEKSASTQLPSSGSSDIIERERGRQHTPYELTVTMD